MTTLTRDEIERIRDGYAGVGWMPRHEVDALLRHALSEPDTAHRVPRDTTETRPPSSTGSEHGASIPAVGGSSPPADTNPSSSVVGQAEPSAPVAEGRMAHAKAVQNAGIRRYLKKRIAALEAENAGLKSRIDAAVAMERERCAHLAGNYVDRNNDYADKARRRGNDRLEVIFESRSEVAAEIRDCILLPPAPEEGR